ncbi:ANTAR domain-containing response regulator [Streptomyces beijiangensis]|uniref:ANTAR domain-containing protein n=1 Tax=Streptomyces beijiangensis TaxID=163361 RepID=A0A939JMH3_9ACTN|nr:ANTAR domain-containing protein [Streptomyces beijiangensis]MBO0517445.1 ANTAR domain-containing protein [Streptomyces beijiangensis]
MEQLHVQAQRWMSSAVGLAALAADEEQAPYLMRQLSEYCTDLLALPSASVLLAEGSGGGRGPGAECLDEDSALVNVDLREQVERWPEFAEHALAEGNTTATLLPLHGTEGSGPVAVLQLLCAERELSPSEVDSAQHLGDLAVLLLTQYRELRQHRETTGQLKSALTNRVVIEQAKGMLAEQLGVAPDTAFEVLRGHARSRRLKLRSVAQAVVDRELVLDPAPE